MRQWGKGAEMARLVRERKRWDLNTHPERRRRKKVMFALGGPVANFFECPTQCAHMGLTHRWTTTVLGRGEEIFHLKVRNC